MNKGEFASEVSRIVKKYPCRVPIIGPDREFILSACKETSRYSSLASEEDIVLKAGWHKIANGRKVKMLFLHRHGGSFGVPISKSVLVDTLYPPKRRKSESSPERSHRAKVITAMRNMVAYQLTDYRKSLKFPVTCWRSERRILKGMKADVDHIGDPFQKIVDDFLAEQGLLFTDIVLKGPVNNKVFKDELLQESWKSFHANRATLALVLASENRSAGSGDYKSREDLLGTFTPKKGESLSLDF